MFEIDDKVIVTENWEGNNTKDKIGTIRDIFEHSKRARVKFEKDQNTTYSIWTVPIRFIIKVDEQTSEY